MSQTNGMSVREAQEILENKIYVDGSKMRYSLARRRQAFLILLSYARSVQEGSDRRRNTLLVLSKAMQALKAYDHIAWLHFIAFSKDKDSTVRRHVALSCERCLAPEKKYNANLDELPKHLLTERRAEALGLLADMMDNELLGSEKNVGVISVIGRILQSSDGVSHERVQSSLINVLNPIFGLPINFEKSETIAKMGWINFKPSNASIFQLQAWYGDGIPPQHEWGDCDAAWGLVRKVLVRVKQRNAILSHEQGFSETQADWIADLIESGKLKHIL